MLTVTQDVKACIERNLEQGIRDFIICPFGDIGMQVKHILNEVYGIEEKYILDSHLCKFNPKIKDISFLETFRMKKYTIILACMEPRIYDEIKKGLLKYVSEPSITSLQAMMEMQQGAKRFHTKVGKYSTGVLCDHWLVESVGAFCSFAAGADVVDNHPVQYITTHHMIYLGGGMDYLHEKKYDDYKDAGWYFEGVVPKGIIPKTKRITIGNDVWLGRNVLITNGANIGNGVIAGAGAVITKDIPDYAVVAGVPARIIRFRYTQDQIKELNRIAWWNWTDKEIRVRFEDFYLPIDEFLNKYR